MRPRSVPTRSLRGNPDLDQLKRQAKELLAAFRAGNADAIAEVRAHYRGADTATFALHDAQLVLARAHGFASWPRLKACVEGVTAARLCEAAARGDLEMVGRLLDRRPELVNFEWPEHGEERPIHIAVLRRDIDMVRLLMQRGADARAGIWPNRDATSALTLATERGYDDIVAVIREEEGLRPRSEAGDVKTKRERPLADAVRHNQPEVVARLLDLGLDPDEPERVEGTDAVVYSSGLPLYLCASSGKLELARVLLDRGADPNAQVHASGSPLFAAYRHGDGEMVRLLEARGGALDVDSVGYLRQTERARRILGAEGDKVVEQLLWSGASGGDAEIVRMTLPRIDWPRDDPRWFAMLWRPLPGHWVRPDHERAGYAECFRLLLARCDANVRNPAFGQTMLHEAIARDHGEGVGFATMLLDAGARLDVRDNLLASTPLGWACRWGRTALVGLLLDRGADPVEAGAPAWATPMAWAAKMGHADVVALLRKAHGQT
jgi:ankyrin repeat protein